MAAAAERERLAELGKAGKAAERTARITAFATRQQFTPVRVPEWRSGVGSAIDSPRSSPAPGGPTT